MHLGGLVLGAAATAAAAAAAASSQVRLGDSTQDRTGDGPTRDGGRPASSSPPAGIPTGLFASLERYARLVDIAYCVGNTATGIAPPFRCVSRCRDFPAMRLVTTWNTGVLSMRDNCGYIAVDQTAQEIVVAFRGTYSITNTVVDLSTIPQEYVPYEPGEPEAHEDPSSLWGRLRRLAGRLAGRLVGRRRRPADAASSSSSSSSSPSPHIPPCSNCTVHSGFLASWKSARTLVLPAVAQARDSSSSSSSRPEPLRVHLVGHSLGGAVAALAGLEMKAVLGWEDVRVTTFGEPRIGNAALATYLEAVFGLDEAASEAAAGPPTKNEAPHAPTYRRITHKDDPVPLLPLADWSYRSHAGEIYIGKADLPPAPGDLRACRGREDPHCIAGGDGDGDGDGDDGDGDDGDGDGGNDDDEPPTTRKRSSASSSPPPRLKPWELFFAHRDYFWRLGLCVPGGDPADWGRERYNYTDEF